MIFTLCQLVFTDFVFSLHAAFSFYYVYLIFIFYYKPPRVVHPGEGI